MQVSAGVRRCGGCGARLAEAVRGVVRAQLAPLARGLALAALLRVDREQREEHVVLQPAASWLVGSWLVR